MATAYDSWLPSVRRKFFEEFKNLNEADLVKLDKENILANWKKLVDNDIADRTFLDVIKNNEVTDAYITFYSDSKIKLKLSQLSNTKRWEFIDSFRNIDDDALNLLKEHPESIEVFFKHTPEAKQLLGQNAGIWMKYFKARQLLKNGNYVELSTLFNKPIGNSDVIQGFKYVTDGIFDVNDLNKAIDIANRTDDIPIISNKIGIPIDILQQAKKHYYIDEHFIFINGEFKIGRFERDFIDNTEWEKMINKSINELTNDEIINFKRLILHEYIESKLMEKGMNFRSFIDPFNYHVYDFGAHEIAPKINDSKYLDLGRCFSPPSPDLNNFENINSILNWYINFYKL